MVVTAEKPIQRVCFAFEYSHREQLNTNPSSSFSLDGEEQPIVWLTEIQTQRSTSGIFHQGSMLFGTLIVFQLSILKKQTHHHCIVERLKRPPKNLQTHPPLPRVFLFRHFSVGYWEFLRQKLAGT
jgi:hypothetical protein